MWTTEESAERAVLVGFSRGPAERALTEYSLLELEELVRSAGGEVVRIHIQERPEPDPAFFIGRGKLEQVRASVFDDRADLVIFDNELSPAQQRNLEKELDVKVIDRSGLILDIFAQRARSREGKLQVELALLEYRLPRLTGKGTALSRLGGGIGTRGPGETKLENDRRIVRRRISRIRDELGRLEDRRALQRQKRQGIPMPTVSLVGYTNAGKSTLFNRLTTEHSLVSPRMFATLDPLVRRVVLPSGQEVLLSDTVGFIRKLPHSLVAAFHATLEETIEADLLLHVIDLSDPSHGLLRSTVAEVLEEIGASDIPVLEVFNKIDLLHDEPLPVLPREGVTISARTGEGVDALLAAVEGRIIRNYQEVRMLIPFDHGEVLAALRERGRVEQTEYLPEGIEVRLALRRADLGRFRQYIVEG
ncbi:MAG: GTPase HflX [Acidobacteriota bacterium]